MEKVLVYFMSLVAVCVLVVMGVALDSVVFIVLSVSGIVVFTVFWAIYAEWKFKNKALGHARILEKWKFFREKI